MQPAATSSPKSIRPTDWPAAWPWYASRYDWWPQAAYHEGMNLLDKQLARWPADQELTLHLLAIKEAFFSPGTPHWGTTEVLPPDPDRPEYDVQEALVLREQDRTADLARAAQYQRNQREAEALLASRAREPS